MGYGEKSSEEVRITWDSLQRERQLHVRNCFSRRSYLYARILQKANAQLGQANSFPERLYRAADWLDQHEHDNMTLDGYFKWLKARDTSRKTRRPKWMRSNSADDDSGYRQLKVSFFCSSIVCFSIGQQHWFFSICIVATILISNWQH
jgi:hypothetical protein